MQPKIYLVDGSGYIFRAFYAITSLRTKDGFPTNALYGFTRMLIKLLNEAGSDHVVTVFDAGKVTFRNELYAEYKATRRECPEDLSQQMPYFRDLAAALGMPVLQMAGYEADDVIGTLARRLSAAGREIIIVSGDKDLMQLVDDRISIWDTMKDQRYGAAEVQSKWGVPPTQITELLGLMGDSSDNIPGLRGAGPKTALQLIAKYRDIENIINSVAVIREDAEIRNRKKLADQIEADSELLRLSRRLVEIDTAVPLMIGPEDACFALADLDDQRLCTALMRQPPLMEKLKELVERFEFTSLLRDFKMPLMTPAIALEDEFIYRTVTRAEWPAFLKEFKAQREFAFDTETTSLDVLSAKLVGVSFSWSDHGAYYIPLAHRAAAFSAILPEQMADLQAAQPSAMATGAAQQELAIGLQPARAARVGKAGANLNNGASAAVPHPSDDNAAPEAPDLQITVAEFFAACAAIFADPTVKKIGQNLKYDCSVLMNYGLEVRGADFDTMLAAYLINPDRRTYNLTALAHDYLGRGVIEYDDVLGERADFRDVPVIEATRYGCQDAHYTWLLRAKLDEEIKQRDLMRVFHEIEMPLVPVLARMELSGIALDSERLALMSKEFETQLQALEQQICTLAGGPFNLNSPKQLSDVLFNRLGISQKGLKKTKTGISTDSSVLEKLALQHPLPSLLLQYRMLHKLKSTYIDALPAQVSTVSGRLHTRFNQTVAGTGRLSSSDPNLQNIPIQTVEGRRIREAFIASPGKRLISADYSQIELRVLAHMSGDENLSDAFRQDTDIHAKTAREILGLGSDQAVDDASRRMGKTINFGVIYGMGAFRLGRELGIPFHVANSYIEQYFANFPKVREYFARLESEAETLGYVTTMFGRRRVLSDIDSSGRDHGFLARVAVNAPIQGTAADIIKLAMIALDRTIRERRLPLTMLLQIHDELVFEAEEKFVDEAVALVRTEMEQVVQLDVPLKVTARAGINWQEAHA